MTSNFAKKTTSSDLNETWYDVRGRWDIHDDMTFKVIRGQGQGQEMTLVPCRDYFYCGIWNCAIFCVVTVPKFLFTIGFIRFRKKNCSFRVGFYSSWAAYHYIESDTDMFKNPLANNNQWYELKQTEECCLLCIYKTFNSSHQKGCDGASENPLPLDSDADMDLLSRDTASSQKVNIE